MQQLFIHCAPRSWPTAHNTVQKLLLSTFDALTLQLIDTVLTIPQFVVSWYRSKQNPNKQGVAITRRNTTGSPWSYNWTEGGMSSPGLRGWSRLQSNYSPLWSVTNDERRRQQTPATVSSPTLCVSGPVISHKGTVRAEYTFRHITRKLLQFCSTDSSELRHPRWRRRLTTRVNF